MSATVERTYRDTWEVGALIRRAARAEMDRLGMPYIEHRGWLDSTFVVTGTAAQWRTLIEFHKQFLDDCEREGRHVDLHTRRRGPFWRRRDQRECDACGWGKR